MKKIYVIVAAAAALMAFSCQRANELDAPVEKTQNLRTFKAIFPSDNVDSKVSLDELGKTGWAIGDVLTIHGKATDQLKTVTLDGTTNTISADNKVATFTVDMSDMTPDDYGTDGFYAAYPHSLYTEYESNRPRYFNCFTDTNHLLLSGVYDSVNDAFVFYNVTGALSFVVDGDTFGGFDEYMVVGKNDETIGFNHFNTRVATGNVSLYHYSSSGAKKAIRASVVDDGKTVNYVYFPVTEENDESDTPGKRAECVDFSEGFYIYFLNAGVITHMVSTSADVRVERQELLTLGDITGAVKPYSTPSKHDAKHPVISGAEDLSATSDGPANCYVVCADDVANKGKVFKFKAVKGNDSDANVGSINSVSILWETYNTSSSVTANSVIAEADFDKQAANSYYEVCFKMPATLHSGNAVLVAKDVYDNILWSWHIWVPANMYTTDDFDASSVDIMSRNLGALVDVDDSASPIDILSYGLFYQWGRKDPFVGPGAVNTTTYAKVAGETMSTTASTYSVAESIAHPTTFVAVNGDWASTTNNELWGDSGTKTIYDPCPPGYRVPKRVSSDPLWSDVDPLPAFSASLTAYWWKIGSAVFPLNGYIYYNGKLDHCFDRSGVWNSHRNSDSSAYCQYIYDNKGAWASEPGWGLKKSYGASVRCAVE